MNYNITSDFIVFGNVTRGRRPNVINVTAAGTVWFYELGFKTLTPKHS